MARIQSVVLAGVVAAAMPAGGLLAAGGEETRELLDLFSPYLDTLAWSWITFIVVLVVLYKFAWPHILKGLDDRERKIRESLEAAERAQNESRRLIEEHLAELEKARAEAREIIDEGKRDAEDLAVRIEADAKAEGTRLLERAVDGE